jgi:hypothetical protein
MEQTINEWFETIEDPEIRAKAFANTKPYLLNLTCESLDYSLATAFLWVDSPEGYDYWSNFGDTL